MNKEIHDLFDYSQLKSIEKIKNNQLKLKKTKKDSTIEKEILFLAENIFLYYFDPEIDIKPDNLNLYISNIEKYLGYRLKEQKKCFRKNLLKEYNKRSKNILSNPDPNIKKESISYIERKLLSYLPCKLDEFACLY